MGGVGVFLSGWERERERSGQRERERGMGGTGAEMVSSIVMYNFGVGPWGTLCLQHFRRATK